MITDKNGTPLSVGDMEKVINMLIRLNRKAANVEELISDITSKLATRLIN